MKVIEGDVDISHKKLQEPSDVKATGNFDCSDNQLTSLEGAPKEIGGRFICCHNQLVSSVDKYTYESALHR